MSSSSVATRRGLTLPVIGFGTLIAIATGAALVLLLQVLPPTNAISPIRRTISEYALTGNKWIFDLAVILIAMGSAVLFTVLALQRLLRPLSTAAMLGALWTVSLLVIVAFPKHNWAVGPSAGGTAHRIASVVGFVCLPIAVLLAARTIFRTRPVWRRIAYALASTSLLWFGLILAGVVNMMAGGEPWWQFLPIGLVERGMAFNELLAVATLAVPLLSRHDRT